MTMGPDPYPQTVIFDDQGIYDQDYAKTGHMIPWSDLYALGHRRAYSRHKVHIAIPWVSQSHSQLLMRSLRRHWQVCDPDGHRAYLWRERWFGLRLYFIWFPLMLAACALVTVILRLRCEKDMTWSEASHALVGISDHLLALAIEFYVKYLLLIPLSVLTGFAIVFALAVFMKLLGFKVTIGERKL